MNTLLIDPLVATLLYDCIFRADSVAQEEIVFQVYTLCRGLTLGFGSTRPLPYTTEDTLKLTRDTTMKFAYKSYIVFPSYLLTNLKKMSRRILRALSQEEVESFRSDFVQIRNTFFALIKSNKGDPLFRAVTQVHLAQYQGISWPSGTTRQFVTNLLREVKHDIVSTGAVNTTWIRPLTELAEYALTLSGGIQTQKSVV